MKTLFMILIPLVGSLAAGAQPTEADKGLLLTYFQNQQFPEAASYIASLRKAHPEDRHLTSLLGYAYYQAGNLTGAATCFQGLYGSDSTDAAALRYLGAIAVAEGNKADALKYYCTLAGLKPGVVSTYKQLAELWMRMGNQDAACYYYRLAYQAGGQHDPEIVSGLASGLVTQELFRRGDSILDAALAEDSAQGEVLKTRIWSAYKQKHYTKIFPLVDKLQQMQDISLAPFLYAAIGYYQLHRYKECENTCAVMILNHVNSRSVLYLLALAYKEEKKYHLSLLTLDECIGDALSADADGYFSAKGSIYETLKQNRQAIREYDTAYYLFKNPLQLYNKARIYDTELKSPRTALRYYRLYRAGRKDTVITEEAAAMKYTAARIKQLESWEAAGRKTATP